MKFLKLLNVEHIMVINKLLKVHVVIYQNSNVKFNKKLRRHYRYEHTNL